MDWITKNSDAIAYIKLSLADEQALQFAAEDNAKVLWDKIRATYIGEGEDRKIDAGNELKNIRMKNGETVADYIARARGISTKCHSLGLDVSPRELVYHTVRGLNGKFSKVLDILKTQRGKSMDEILQILREEEATLNLPIKTRMDGIYEAFYCKRKNEKQTRLCYICRKSNHLAKDCYYRNKNSPSTSQRNNSSRNGHVFTASYREEKLCDNIWILDSGASCHMAKESMWFKNISPEVMDIYLADKNSKMMSQGTGNVSAKTVSTKHCNSINLTITDVSYVPQLRCNLLSVTCLMDKGCKIKSENNCVLIYDKNDKLITKAFKNNGRLEIKLEPMYNSECFISDQSTNNYEIWHNRGDGVCVTPPGYEKLIGDDKVCKLKKSIYGLPQSGRNWYMKIKGELENFGLKRLASDNCVFIKSVDQSVLILCMYVDDLAIFCNNDKMYEDIVINGDRYRVIITSFFIPELNNHDVQELWFQQDGATCHAARATIDLLKDTFGDRLISRFGPVNWPSRFCDLTPLDCFLWGYVTSLVYADKPQTLDHLEDNIRRVIADIRPQMLEIVIENWTSR
ncbi:retrovirus-related Pol polyprotein from transposon TNT 1-94 [Trichonephila clavipes]|nr:retrovirus-related Pol polyprotein from transposon TNT 1-94 [Trichonephila clavipes]